MTLGRRRRGIREQVLRLNPLASEKIYINLFTAELGKGQGSDPKPKPENAGNE